MSERPNAEYGRRGCEVCWDLAYVRSRMMGGSQADHYRDLLRENDGLSTHQPTQNDGSEVAS